MSKTTVFLAVAAICSAAVLSSFFSGSGERGTEATVQRVVDGDTLELANHDVVRLIGVDAPEKDQPYYGDVIEQMREMEGKFVRLEKDKTNKDRYGRYLRYVYLDGKMVNLELVRSGMAYAYVVHPDDSHESEFLEAESAARKAGIGIWSSSEHADCVSLESLHYNARGDDSENIGDEFFSLKNLCDETIEASGWTVRNSLRSYRIPDFSIEPESSVRIYSGNSSVSGRGAHLSSERPVWNNDGDSLHLRDGKGRTVLSRSYKNSRSKTQK